MTEFRDWFYKMPFFTGYWLTLSIGLTLFTRLQFVHYSHFILDIRPIINDYQIWRPLSALFYYPTTFTTTFHFLMNCFILYQYSMRLETRVYSGKAAEYFCMLLFNWVCCVVIGLLINYPLLMDSMVMSVVVVWCKLNPYTEVSSIFRFKFRYLPWVLMVFHTIVHGSGVLEFFGILVGTLSHFLLFDLPEKCGGPALLTPPNFLKRWLSEAKQPGEFELAPAAPLPGHLWGHGKPLASKQ